DAFDPNDVRCGLRRVVHVEASLKAPEVVAAARIEIAAGRPARPTGPERIGVGGGLRLVHADDHLHAFLDARAFDDGLLAIGDSAFHPRHGELTFLIETPKHRRRLAARARRSAGTERRTCNATPRTAIATELTIAERPIGPLAAAGLPIAAAF